MGPAEAFGCLGPERIAAHRGGAVQCLLSGVIRRHPHAGRPRDLRLHGREQAPAGRSPRDCFQAGPGQASGISGSNRSNAVPSTARAVRPAAVPLVCSSPTSQRTPHPAEIGIRRPSGPAAQPSPAMTKNSWAWVAGCVPIMPPGTSVRQVSWTFPSPVAMRVARNPSLLYLRMIFSPRSNRKISTESPYPSAPVGRRPQAPMNAKPQPRKSGSSSLASSLASSAAVITPEEINGPAMAAMLSW